MGGQYSGERPWRRSREVIAIANPAAGADWSKTVPGGEVWRLHTVTAELVTSAVVASRIPVLTVEVNGRRLLYLRPTSAITAGSDVVFSWFGGVGRFGAATFEVQPFPELDLEPGSVVKVTTAAIDTGDQWSAISLYVTRTRVKLGPVDLADIPAMVVEIAAAPEG